jgi:hypothetical protein
MFELQIDASELVRVAGRFDAFHVPLMTAMQAAMMDTGALLANAAAIRTPVCFGFLRASIGMPTGFGMRSGASEVVGTVGAGGSGGGSGTPVQEYVWYVEEGTRPHWPPIAPLKIWALRKLGDEGAAYAVQRKIAKRGTKGVFMFKTAFMQYESTITAIWNNVIKLVTDAL